MEELKRCLELRRKIDEIDDRILDIKSKVRHPKTQTLSCMPRNASQSDSAIERYIITLDKLQARRGALEEELYLRWVQIEKTLDRCSIARNDKRLLSLRFYSGLSWKKCTAKMQKLDATWNENKTFRRYREVVKVVQENGGFLVQSVN